MPNSRRDGFQTRPRTDEQEKIRQHFNAVSDYWHDIYHNETSFMGHHVRQRQSVALRLLRARVDSGAMVLDVGCGTGPAALELAAEGFLVTGIDFAPSMIESAQESAEKRHLSVDFRVGNAEQLDFPDGHFEAVIALGLLASFRDDRRALAEMHRVLKPGGILIVTLPNTLALDRWLALPRSLPILAPASLRPAFRRVGNLGRRLLKKPAKPLADLRFGKSGAPLTYARHLKKIGFADVRYTASSYGPLMPLGFNWFSEANLIRISDTLGRSLPNWLGSVIIYYAHRA
jgi:ubiquinone/menaquinone biosynthesis C-methylase UbiE